MTGMLGDNRIRNAARQFALADDYPKVALAYPRTGVWSGKNQLGFEMPFDPNAATPQTILKLDEWGFPRNWTVSLGVRFDTELAATEAFDAVAIVDFGSGGIMQQVNVDFVDGTVFCLPMNAINVRCVLNPLQAFSATPVPNGVKVSVLLAHNAPARSRATFTHFLNLPPGSTSSAGFPNLRIPLFAKSVQILPLNNSDNPLVYSAAFSIKFFANSLATIPVASVTGDHLTPGTKIPIPALARYFVAENTGATAMVASSIWNLFDE